MQLCNRFIRKSATLRYSNSDVSYICLSLLGENRVCVAGFGAVLSDGRSGLPLEESSGCKDALISESYLTLAFPDRVECWDLQGNEKTRTWSMEIERQSGSSGNV